MRLKSNKPKHGMGEFGKPTRMKGLMAGTHMPQRVNSGFDDRKGYEGSAERRNGSLMGGKLSTPARTGGNGRGSAPPGVKGEPGVRGSLESHAGNAGRGGTGRIGKRDAYKGKPTQYPNDISHSAFEKLGAD